MFIFQDCIIRCTNEATCIAVTYKPAINRCYIRKCHGPEKEVATAVSVKKCCLIEDCVGDSAPCPIGEIFCTFVH